MKGGGEERARRSGLVKGGAPGWKHTTRGGGTKAD